MEIHREGFGEKRDREKIIGERVNGMKKEEWKDGLQAGIPIDREDLNKKGGDFASLIYTLKKVQD